jgi:MGT family glycosyltransferase
VSDPPTPLTVLFMPESAYGPTNNCIGIGNVLRERGHRVVFAAEASWHGQLTALGFEEDLVHLSPPTSEPQDAGQFWKDFIRQTAPEFRKPTIRQLETWVQPVWEELIVGARFCEPALREIITRTGPDVIVEDNVVTFPALHTAGVPVVRIVSCNPLEMKGPDVAPTFSGYPANDRTDWPAFRAEYDRTHRPLWTEFNAWVVEQGAPPLPDLEFIHDGDLNLYVYPEELDYVDDRPLGPTWHRVDSSVRTTVTPIELPTLLTDRPEGSALIYFSLGSLGSADVKLMRRVIAALARTPHRYIVSKGPLHEEVVLAPNMWGAEFLPQVELLPQVDLVITHGGNNTVTEAVHFGVPMIVLPLFWDQYDNAQRVQESGFGVRLDPYRFTDTELRKTIKHLLTDDELRARVAAAGTRIQALNGVDRAADLIEQAARPDSLPGFGGPGGLGGPGEGTQIGVGHGTQ